MPLSLDENRAEFQIKSYQPGRIQINDQTYTHPLMVTPHHLFTQWDVTNITEMTAESFHWLVTLKPDILLIGTGEKSLIIPITQYGELINLGIGVEVMNTAAACRTFNALSAENRDVAAALFLI